MKKTNNTIAVLGLWHLGIITAVGLAELGNNVFGYDLDKKKIAMLKKGKPTIYEPQLEELLNKNIKQKRLLFTTDLSLVKKAKYIFIALDTPLNEADEVDTTLLFKLAKKFSLYLKDKSIIIISSQVPVGTTEKILTTIKKTSKAAKDISIAYIPENLRLGRAFDRFFNPAMIVVGTDKEQTFQEISTFLFKKINTKIIKTTIKTAEFVKHAINTYLATSISFANEMGNIADEVGANYKQAADIIKIDERIGKYARIDPGLGFAGGTLARDLKILQKISKQKNYNSVLINAILSTNERQKKWVIRKLKNIFKNQLRNKKIGVLGLTYTSQTSTLRRSLSLETIQDIQKEGATVYAYDPKADQNELKIHKNIKTVKSVDELANEADALIIMTEWNDFLSIDYKKIKQQMRMPIVIDPKNFLEEISLEKKGYLYYGLGRGTKDAIL